MQPNQRRAVIVTAALRLAREIGLARIMHSDVAARCVLQTSTKTVKHYFPSRESLWRAILDDATPGEFDAQRKEVGL